MSKKNSNKNGPKSLQPNKKISNANTSTSYVVWDDDFKMGDPIDPKSLIPEIISQKVVFVTQAYRKGWHIEFPTKSLNNILESLDDKGYVTYNST